MDAWKKDLENALLFARLGMMPRPDGGVHIPLLHDRRWKRADGLELAGVTQGQFNIWLDRGHLAGHIERQLRAPGKGYHRFFSGGEILIFAARAALVQHFPMSGIDVHLLETVRLRAEELVIKGPSAAPKIGYFSFDPVTRERKVNWSTDPAADEAAYWKIPLQSRPAAITVFNIDVLIAAVLVRLGMRMQSEMNYPQAAEAAPAPKLKGAKDDERPSKSARSADAPQRTGDRNAVHRGQSSSGRSERRPGSTVRKAKGRSGRNRKAD